VVENTPYHLSTIFIAVIYGLAVIFYLNPLESFAVYLIGNAFIIYFFPFYHSYYFYTSYVEDSIVNCMIAWVISVINYKNFLRHFINQKIIERNNLELSRKNNQIEEMNGYLKDASLKDPLTGIFNRRKLNDVLKIACHEALEKKLTFSIILLDIDKFKSINDKYGHKTGDIVLKEIGKIFIKNINWPYVVGRWGGEEFMIVCPCTDLGEAMQLSEKIRMSIEIHNFLPVGTTTASFGVSSYSKGDSIEDVIQRADEALYRAKNRGRNRVETAS
ncbi:MAG: GGDEF domain-containing protein, partial [Clostridia bacterium]|nr:GGDEF domain-containing protein [Clostridia bacterium]